MFIIILWEILFISWLSCLVVIYVTLAWSTKNVRHQQQCWCKGGHWKAAATVKSQLAPQTTLWTLHLRNTWYAGSQTVPPIFSLSGFLGRNLGATTDEQYEKCGTIIFLVFFLHPLFLSLLDGQVCAHIHTHMHMNRLHTHTCISAHTHMQHTCVFSHREQ